MQMNERAIQLNRVEPRKNARYVLYWMQMYKRASHNHALTFAIHRANELNIPLVVYEGLKYYYPWASDRLHTFILEGVEEKQREFARLGIRYIFYLQKDNESAKRVVSHLCQDAACLVTDDFPCFIIPEHNRRIAARVNVPVYAIDSNGVIPMSKFDSEEYAAYTIRPKIRKFLHHYLQPFVEESVETGDAGLELDCPETTVTSDAVADLVAQCDIDHSVKPSLNYRGGTTRARERLTKFVNEILPGYEKTRNRPELDGSSRLSPYIHFGFISPLEIALAVKDAEAPEQAKETFIEELVVRRELSFNFTFHNPSYDSLASLPPWAQDDA